MIRLYLLPDSPPKAAKPAFDAATVSTALLTRQVECITVIAAEPAIAQRRAAD